MMTALHLETARCGGVLASSAAACSLRARKVTRALSLPPLAESALQTLLLLLQLGGSEQLQQARSGFAKKTGCEHGGAGGTLVLGERERTPPPRVFAPDLLAEIFTDVLCVNTNQPRSLFSVCCCVLLAVLRSRVRRCP